MVSFTTTATVSLIAFATMIQPSIQAKAAFKIGAQVVGGVLGGGGGGNQQQRRDAPAANTGAAGPFAQCISEIHADGTKLFLHTQDHTAILTPVPDSCIKAANDYNSVPNIQEIEAAQGKIEVQGKSIKLSGVEGEVQKMLEQNAAKTAEGEQEPATQ